MSIKNSELILNPDGSIYHLHLKPSDISDTIIFVGDQERVGEVTKHFDSIDFEVQSREFKTQTGTYKGKRLSVISTGIGPDNIDIVLNELDALVNIDFETREIKATKTSLSIVRIGTSGALQPDIDIDSFVLSAYGMDINGMLQSYKIDAIKHADIEAAFVAHTQWSPQKPYPVIIQKMDSFEYNGLRVTNFEMETSAIYGLSKLLGHEACSMNAILANRALGTFSKNPQATIEKLIIYTLNKLIS